MNTAVRLCRCLVGRHHALLRHVHLRLHLLHHEYTADRAIRDYKHSTAPGRYFPFMEIYLLESQQQLVIRRLGSSDFLFQGYDLQMPREAFTAAIVD